MKKLAFAILMCVATMSAKAQVLNSTTVKNVYEEVSHKAKSKFAYNADFTRDDITTMYVYNMRVDRNDMLTLTPYLKYDYAYAIDGTLTNKVTYHWDDGKNDWACAARYDYNLDSDKYSIEYSRYNQKDNCFDKPVDKMVYSLLPYDGVNYVSYYHREAPSMELQLINETQVTCLPLLFAEK